MGEHSKIEWTDHTFNIVWGCTKVSPACDHCYAETFSKRVGFAIWGQDAPRRTFGDVHWAQPLQWNRKAERRGARARVFCGSMCDVMEDRRDLDPWRERLYEVIEQTPHLDWMLLTKRPQNFRRFLPKAWLADPLPNVRGMTTVESAEYYWRIDALAQTPLARRGLSVEPLLGPVDLTKWLGDSVDWMIVGGESGPGARPFDLAWARSLVRQCEETGAACFLKQLGALPMLREDEWRRRYPDTAPDARHRRRVPEGYLRLLLKDAKGGDIDEFPADLRVRQLPQ